ncbi:MAG: hypothetical protein ABUT20_57665, partial [Bacteroidota bacterium]
MSKIFPKTLLLCIVTIINITAKAQSTAADSTLLQLSFTTFDGKPIATAVHFENEATHNILNFKTNKEGKLECRLRIGKKFIIRIDNSDDFYEYTIPDADGFPVNFTFRYHLLQKEDPFATIRLFNNTLLKEISIKSLQNNTQVEKIKDNSVRFTLLNSNSYSIQAPGITIKNNAVQPFETETGNVHYILYFSDETHAELIPVSNRQTVINVVYEDIYDKPVPGEAIVIKATKTAAKYNLKTVANGSAIAILPVDDHYSVSLKHFENVFDIDIKKENYSIFSNNLHLNYPSSKQYEDQLREEVARLAKRDSLYKLAVKEEKALMARLDSIARLAAKEKTTRAIEDYPLIESVASLGASSYVTCKFLAERDLAAATKGLKTDPNYFKHARNTVCAILNRNKWASKMIVADVTGSMNPYTQQVALWHLLEMMGKERSDYVFFNDGDNTPDNAKVIGKTGGIYPWLKRSAD